MEINTKYTGKCILYFEIQTEAIHGSNSDNSFSERRVSAAILTVYKNAKVFLHIFH